MTESKPHEELQDILSEFDAVEAQRPETEAEAKDRRKVELKAADATLKKDIKKADETLYKAHQAQKQARTRLGHAGLYEQAQFKPSVSPPSDSHNADPAAQLEHSVAQANAATEKISRSISEWREWKRRRATRRRRLTNIVFGMLIILIIAGVLGYMELHYQSAVAAIEAREWETAVSELQQLTSIGIRYRDAQDLLNDTYADQADAAVNARQWGRAAETIIQLYDLDPTHEDLQSLVATYPELRAALESRGKELLSTEFSLTLLSSTSTQFLSDSQWSASVLIVPGEAWSRLPISLEDAQWIWKSGGATSYRTIRFRHIFKIPADVGDLQGHIEITVDDAYELSLNGAFIGKDGELDASASKGGWQTIETYPFNPSVGDNELNIRAINYRGEKANPAGVFYQAEITGVRWEISAEPESEGTASSTPTAPR